METLRIPCVIMRGGTSRGPYFLAADLPADRDRRDAVLLAAMGSGHELEIDGIGGGHALTSKVAIISPSSRPGAAIDYLFAQVLIKERVVDYSPNCGNMLAGVGPYAIEAGLVSAQDGITTVRIYNVNTQKVIEAKVQTPGARVTYDGDTAIDGVPGTAAPIYLAFEDAAGSKTGSLLPTGSPSDVIDGITVSCVDAAMPVMLVRARDLGVTGYERPAEYAAMPEFLGRLESLRVEAGRLMGIAGAKDLVIPKPVLVAEPVNGGMISTRYFMPHDCHTALSVTGGVAIATAAVTPGTLAAEIAGHPAMPVNIVMEHASGSVVVRLETGSNGAPTAYAVRTARRIIEGTMLVSVPDSPALQRAPEPATAVA